MRGRNILVSRHDPKVGLALIADEQHGRVARRQLLRAGWSNRMIRTARKHRELVQQHSGVYAVGHQAEVVLGRETAALLAVGDGAILTGMTVLMHHEVLPREPHRPIDVAVIGARKAQNRPGITVHRYTALTHADVQIRDGLPMTTVERALLDAAPELSSRELERAVDEALARRLTSRTKIRELLGRTAGRIGQQELAALADPSRPSSQTIKDAAEYVLRLIREAGLPECETEAPLHGFKADFFWSEAGVVLEVDSHIWHGIVKANYQRDRRKDRVFRRHGLIVVRVDIEDVKAKPLPFIADLAATIAEGMAARRAA